MSRNGQKNGFVHKPEAADDLLVKDLSEFLDRETKSKDQFAVDFLNKGIVTKILQVWSFTAQVGHTGTYVKTCVAMWKLLRFLEQEEELVETGVEFIKTILTKYDKTIVKAVSSLRAPIVTHTLRLMNEIVLFKKSSLIDDFIALFDFNLSMLPRLLVPSKTDLSDINGTKAEEASSMRYCFIRLLLNILQHSSPITRKDFLSNHSKLTSQWLKFVTVIDSDSLIDLTLTVWENKILKEPSFKKSTKLKIFNEWNLPKLLPLYYSPIKEIQSKFNKFILLLATDKQFGLRFPNNDSWFLDSSNGIISVNNKSFKSNNKVIFSILTSLKPWDDDRQLNTIVKIIDSIPELFIPYINYLVTRGTHDPKLSSYWLGITLLLNKLLNLEIPTDLVNYENFAAPNKSITTELIIPCLLNRSTLQKCLNHEALLIRQLSLQMIIFVVRRLKKFMKLYDDKNWKNNKFEIINNVYIELPDLQAILNSLVDSYTKSPENKILLLTYLMTINEYVEIFQDKFNYLSLITKPYLDLINNSEANDNKFSNIDLLLLDNFFKLQEGENSQVKWWNKSENSNSLFTLLLKVSSSPNNNISNKIEEILINLISQTNIFNNNFKINQIILLSQSLKEISSTSNNNTQMNKIWKLLDETISRCVKTPFKYLDISNSLNRISPFIITLVEQFKFVDKSSDYENVLKWMVLFFRLCIIGGEPINSIVQLMKDSGINYSQYENYLDFDNYEKNEFIKEEMFQNLSEVSYFEFITTSSIEQLKKSNRIPVCEFDIIGLLFRIQTIISDKETNFKSVETVLSNLLTSFGNFCYSNLNFNISNARYWNEIFLNEEFSGNEKANYVSGSLAEIFEQLENFDSSEFANKVEKYLSKTEISNSEEIILSKSVWSIKNIDLLKTVLTKKNKNHATPLLKNSILNKFLESKNKIKISEIIELISTEELIPIIIKMIDSKLILFDYIQLLLDSINKITSENIKFQLLTNLIKDSNLISPFLNYFKNDIINTTFLLCSFSDEMEFTEEQIELISSNFTNCKDNAISLINKENFKYLSFEKLSKLFTNKTFSNVSKQEKEIVLNFAIKNKKVNKYSTEIVKLMNSMGEFDNEDVKLWMNKCVLFMTKKFAENDELTTSFEQFLTEFKKILIKINLRVLNKNNLNSLLEIIHGKWLNNENALELSLSVLNSAGIKDKQIIQSNKLLQISINNEKNPILINPTNINNKMKYLYLLNLFKIFKLDEAKNSNSLIQEQLLLIFNGTNSPQDLIIFEILKIIEEKLNSTWINSVYSWDFINLEDEENETELIGEIKLIEKKKEGLVITINKQLIKQTINDYKVSPIEFNSEETSFEYFEQFYKQCQVINSDKEEYKYNSYFMLLLILNNEELIYNQDNEEGVEFKKVDIKKLVESGLFEFILINLSSTNSNIKQVAVKFLEIILNSVKNDKFKDQLFFEIFITKILYSFAKREGDGDDEEGQLKLTPILFSFVSKIGKILSNPNHYLYVKCYKWVLKGPYIKANDLPLFKEISIITDTSEDSETYYKQLNWFIDCLISGTKTSDDLKLLNSKNIFEWLLNLKLSPYIFFRLRFKIIEFFSIVQKIDPAILITRFGILCKIQQEILSLTLSLQNDNNEDVFSRQELLNLKEFGIRFGAVCNNKKRVVDWTSGDLNNFTKRLNI